MTELLGVIFTKKRKLKRRFLKRPSLKLRIKS